ncbi:MAG: LPXTG cell wall anchor domain-containing protein [Dysosmobacter sp.]|nr:LPXTG cell wall anchor domain-containing protein [Dysosmobacter sp.]
MRYQIYEAKSVKYDAQQRYADDTEDYYGRNSLKSLNDDAHLIDAKETENIFANIENEIIYLVDAGSFVNDYMGYVEGDYNFDLVNQASKLYITEGKTRLDAVEIEANKYGFGMWKEGETVGYKYVVTYTPAADGQEHIEWTINVPVTNLRHVQLHYTVELTNPKTAVGTYGQYDEDGSQGYAGLYTNNSATLYPMATGATETGEGEDFLKPTVSYEVKGGGGTIITPVKPDPKPDPDPEPPTDIDEPTTPSDPGSDIDEPETPTTPAEPPKTGDMMPLFAGMAAVSAAAIMLLSRKRKEA